MVVHRVFSLMLLAFLGLVLVAAPRRRHFSSTRTSLTAIVPTPTCRTKPLSMLGIPTTSAIRVSGGLRYDIGSSSTKAHTYFATGEESSVLGVGDTLTASISLVPKVFLYDGTSRSLRMFVGHDPTDPKVTEDTNDDGGGGSEDP